MLRILVKGLFGRLSSYASFAVGFWFLFLGFSRPGIPLGILGGGAILGAMYLMVVTRRGDRSPPLADYPDGEQEGNPSDSLDGGDKGGKLPP